MVSPLSSAAWRRIPTSISRASGFDLVRISLGLLLLIAAALKAHELATRPVVAAGLLSSRWQLIALVELELLLGVWMLAGYFPWLMRRVAFGCFGVFAAAAFYQGLSGQDACGCFGRLSINPWVTFVVDIGAVAALALWAPTRSRASVMHWAPVRVAAVTIGSILLILSTAFAMGQLSPAYLSADGDLLESGKIVVIEPERWIGKRFPLLSYTDIGERLTEGEWIVLLYHHDCSECQKALPHYEGLARQCDEESSATQVALLEIPPFGKSPLAAGSGLAIGRLNEEREWFATTPVEIWLREGIVSKVVRTPAEAKERISVK